MVMTQIVLEQMTRRIEGLSLVYGGGGGKFVPCCL